MKKKTISFLCASLLFLSMCVPCIGQDHFVIGNEEGDGFLAYPRYIHEGPDGNIYVFDWGDFYIKVFSPEGKYLKRIGGKGQGPGEVQRADGANFGFTPEGILYFTEFIRGHRWITFMELSGEFIKVLTPDINETYGITNSFPLEDGGFLVRLSFMSKPEMKKDYFLYKSPRVLVRIDSEGKIISELIRKEYFSMISSIGDGATSGLPYVPAFAWIPYKDNTVLFSDGMTKSFEVYDYQGKLVREITTDLPAPEKVTSRDLNAWRRLREEMMMVRNPDWYNRFGRVIEKYKKSLYDKPNLDGISSTPEGNILVEGSDDFEETEENYWLLDGNGKTLAHMKIAGGWLRIDKNFVFFQTSDEDANISVHCVKRQGSEKDDFLRIKELVNQN